MPKHDPEKLNLITSEVNDKYEPNQEFILFGKQRALPKCKNSVSLLLSFLLIVIPTIAYSTIVPYYYEDIHILILIYTMSTFSFLYCLFCLFDVATTIPGYLERGNMTEAQHDCESPRIIVKNEVIMLKLCSTCKITRTLRSFHCAICKRCVLRHDHHCGFVGNCIGQNNTNKFYFFLLSTCVHSLFVCVFILIRFGQISWVIQPINWRSQDYLGMILVIYSSIFFSVLLLFLMFQLYLILTNQTTNEFIRGRNDKKLFDQGCKNNWNEVC